MLVGSETSVLTSIHQRSSILISREVSNCATCFTKEIVNTQHTNFWVERRILKASCYASKAHSLLRLVLVLALARALALTLLWLLLCNSEQRGCWFSEPAVHLAPPMTKWEINKEKWQGFRITLMRCEDKIHNLEECGFVQCSLNLRTFFTRSIESISSFDASATWYTFRHKNIKLNHSLIQ